MATARRGAAHTKEPGIVRVRHLLVLLVFVVVAAMAVGALALSNFRSGATAEAQNLMYATAAYILDCATGDQNFEPDYEDSETYLLTSAQLLNPYGKKPFVGDFKVALSKDKEPLYAVSTHRLRLLGWELVATGVYPKDAPERGSFTWHSITDAENE